MVNKLVKTLSISLSVALLACLLAITGPASALSQPQVSFASGQDDDISRIDANMNILFTVDQQLGSLDTITIIFPSETGLSPVSAYISAGEGFYDGSYLPSGIITSTSANWSINTSQKAATLTLSNGDKIGSGAQVSVNFTAGITNPDIIGDYTLLVYTSQETTPVVSALYSIGPPYVPPLPGIVTRKNSAGVILNQYTGSNALVNAINAAYIGDIIEVGDGTYDYTMVSSTISLPTGGITITATGDEAIVIGDWIVTSNGVDSYGNPVNTVIDGLIIKPAAAGDTLLSIGASANNTVFSNCTFQKSPFPVPVASTPMISVGSASSTTDQAVTFTNCTFDSTYGEVADNIIQILNGPVMIDSCIFNVDASSVYVNDRAVWINGNTSPVANTVTITNSTFTGNSGIGVENVNPLNPTMIEITGSTFDGLAKAVYLNTFVGGLLLESNTIKNSTVPEIATVRISTAAIDLSNSGSSVNILMNEIINNNGLSVMTGPANANVASIVMAGNAFTGNTFGVINKNTATTLNAEMNYWGNSSGPTITSNPGGTGDPIVAPSTEYGIVDYEPWISAPVIEIATTLNILAGGGTIDRSSTVGVIYIANGNTEAITGITLLRYVGNPTSLETPHAILNNGYYDVYSPNADGDTTLIFYNNKIDRNTKIYYYNELQQDWLPCSNQHVVGTNAYVYASITATSDPDLSQLDGTVFALVNSGLDAQRDMPVYTFEDETFDVTVTFTAPSDGFNSIGLSDYAPEGWEVAVDETWCSPTPFAIESVDNGAFYVWAGPFDEGQVFSATYRASVPPGVSTGPYSFTGNLEYYIGDDPPVTVAVSGDDQIFVINGAQIVGITYESNGSILDNVTIFINGQAGGTSSIEGIYQLFVTGTGEYTITASKEGFRPLSQTITVSDFETVYILDFIGPYGLIPNAPSLSYVLSCINIWKYPPGDGTGLSLPEVLAVINAWKYPF